MNIPVAIRNQPIEVTSPGKSVKRVLRYAAMSGPSSVQTAPPGKYWQLLSVCVSGITTAAYAAQNPVYFVITDDANVPNALCEVIGTLSIPRSTLYSVTFAPGADSMANVTDGGAIIECHSLPLNVLYPGWAMQAIGPGTYQTIYNMLEWDE